jgi:hypothetical protein
MATLLLFGASTSGHVWFGFELGAGKFLGNITGTYIEDGKTRTEINKPYALPYVKDILPILNLKLGVTF